MDGGGPLAERAVPCFCPGKRTARARQPVTGKPLKRFGSVLRAAPPS
jgi:hypothetical protein